MENSASTLPTPPPPPKQPNIWQKWHYVASQLTTAIPKLGQNEGADGGYSFAMAASVYEKVRPHLLAARLLPIFHAKSYHLDTPNGNVYITGLVHLVDVDNPSSFYDIEVIGAGNDSGRSHMGDKGVYKGLTGMIKYFFLNNLLLPTSDDPEVTRAEEIDPNRKQVKPVAQPAPVSMPVAVVKEIAQPKPQPAPEPNGAPGPTDVDVERLLKQSQMAAALDPVEAELETAEEEPVDWVKDMRRQAEDSKTSAQVVTLWNSSKDELQRLQIEQPAIYRELHNYFRSRKDVLKTKEAGS